MKKTLLIAGALLALTAGMANAGGLNLSWNDCGAFGTELRAATCLNNSTPVNGGTIICSAIAPVVMDQLVAFTSVVDLQTTTAALNPWWLMGAGGCRNGAMSANVNFSTGPFNCADVWGGQASGGMVYIQPPSSSAPNRARVKATFAVAAPVAADDVTESYIIGFSFSGVKTAGTGSCAGCLDGACIVFNNLELNQPLGVGDYVLSNAILRQHIRWQAAGSSVTGGCPDGTPTRNTTWGSVKSLYR